MAPNRKRIPTRKTAANVESARSEHETRSQVDLPGNLIHSAFNSFENRITITSGEPLNSDLYTLYGRKAHGKSPTKYGLREKKATSLGRREPSVEEEEYDEEESLYMPPGSMDPRGIAEHDRLNRQSEDSEEFELDEVVVSTETR